MEGAGEKGAAPIDIYHQGWGTRREPDAWWRRTGANGSYECTYSQCTC